MIKIMKKPNQENPDGKKGFTIIEVMLVLAVTGLLLVSVLGGAYQNISTQRFNDALRSFAEFLRQNYSEVISPESIGKAEEDDLNIGYSTKDAIYGKVLVFGLNDEDKVASSRIEDTVYSVTLVGDAIPPKTSSGDFITDLNNAHVRLYCGDNLTGGVSTLSSYNPAWQTKILTAAKESGARGDQFEGTVIIARSPTSGVVHTAFAEKIQPQINELCSVDNNHANVEFQEALATPGTFKDSDDITFCLRSESSRLLREVKLTAGGHNTSAVTIVDADDPEGKCY